MIMDNKDKQPANGRNAPLRSETSSTMQSTSSSEIPSPSTSNATSPMETTDHEEDKVVEHDSESFNQYWISQRSTCGEGLPQPIAKHDRGAFLPKDGSKQTNGHASKQIAVSDSLIASAFPMRILTKIAPFQEEELPKLGIKGSHASLPAPLVEDNKSSRSIPNKWTYPFPPWSHGGHGVAAGNASQTSRSRIAHNGLRSIQFGAAERTVPGKTPMGLGSAVLIEPEPIWWTEEKEQLFNRAPGTLFPPVGSLQHTSRLSRYPPRNASGALNNENLRPIARRDALARIFTTKSHTGSFLDPAVPSFSQVDTQTFPMVNEPMVPAAVQLFSSPEHFNGDSPMIHACPRTPSNSSTIRVRRQDGSPSPVTAINSTRDRLDFELTGYYRTDPTILWADSIPPAIVAPHARHPETHLLGTGFLHALDLPQEDTTTTNNNNNDPETHHSFNPEIAFDFDIDAYDNDNNGGPPAMTIVTADSAATVPPALTAYLTEKAERERRNREADEWRRVHVREVVRRHEESVFERPAGEGEFERKEWHMSGEYHGQTSGGGGGGKGGRVVARGGGTGGSQRGAGRGGWGGGGGGRGRSGVVGMGSKSGSSSSYI